MLTSVPTRRLAVLATACLVSVALPAAPAWAQKTKSKPAAEASAPEIETTIDIPTVDAVDANLDEDALRDIFSGNIADNADGLAGLTATSITIPEINVSVTSTVDGDVTDTSVNFTDLVFNDVTDGVAASISLAGVAIDSGEDGSADIGAMSANDFNIAGVLGLYGLVPAADSTELETIYNDFTFEGASLTSPDVSCTMGGASVANFKARPLAYSLTDMFALAESMDKQGDDPSPETIGKALRMYADFLTAFESSPTTFDGFDCEGVDDEDRPISFSVAGMSMGGMSPGIYPGVSMEGLDISVEGDGKVGVGSVTFKPMDLSGPIAAIEAAPEALDEAWFTANARSLFPAMEGFAFSDVVVDVPDPEAEGGRIKGGVGAFDLTLSSYLNGLPTAMTTTASNITLTLPQDSSDEQLRLLASLGVTDIDAGFKVDAAWNEAEDTIAINEISVTGKDLASVLLSGTIANATEALFSLDENDALMASMAVAIRSLKVDIADFGLSDILLNIAATEQGSDPATMRPIFAGLAEGTVIGMLAGAAEAQKVGGAVNAFVSGKAKSLTIEMTAKESPGLGIADFMAAEDDPTVLIGKVNIDASAK